MDKNTFWKIIETAKKKSGTNMELRYKTLASLLVKYEPDDIIKFGKIASVYVEAAEENYAVWAACKAIEGYASDDTFLYFCCWLVSQGNKTYTQAVKNPESLANRETKKYDDHTFEMLMAVAFEAYGQKTGKQYDETAENTVAEVDAAALLEDIEFVDDTPFRKDELEAKRQIPLLLPKLTEMFTYDAKTNIIEMEKLLQNPDREAALDEMRKILIESGVDISRIPGLAPQPPRPASADKYDTMNLFYIGLAAVQKDGKWGFIDVNGDEIVPLIYDRVCDFTYGDFVVIELDGKMGYVHKSGKVIVEPMYDEAYGFGDNEYAEVKLDGKKGFVNQEGQEVVPLIYDEFEFGENEIKGRIGNKWETIKFNSIKK
jgi:hypothetical protein